MRTNRRVITPGPIRPLKFYTAISMIVLHNGKPEQAEYVEVENNGGY